MTVEIRYSSRDIRLNKALGLVLVAMNGQDCHQQGTGEHAYTTDDTIQHAGHPSRPMR